MVCNKYIYKDRFLSYKTFFMNINFIMFIQVPVIQLKLGFAQFFFLHRLCFQEVELNEGLEN